MKHCLIILTIFVTGCESYIDTQDVKTMNIICEHNGGLSFAIMTHSIDGYDVYKCNDGAKFDVKSHSAKGME